MRSILKSLSSCVHAATGRCQHLLPVRVLWMGGLLGVSGIMGCAGDRVLDPEPVSATDVLYALQIQTRGLTMGVGEEFPLAATAISFLGEAMTVPDSAPIQFVSSDTTRVRITSDGVIHALQPTLVTATEITPARIIATWQWNKRVRADTAYVAVTATAAPGPIVSLLFETDSTWASLGGAPVRVKMSARTADGTLIPNVFAHLSSPARSTGFITGVEYTSAVPGKASIQGTIPTGRYWVYATGMIYGTLVKDSLEFVSLDPMGAGFQGRLLVYYKQIVISCDLGVDPDCLGLVRNVAGTDPGVAPCAPIQVLNRTSIAIRITFENPLATSQCLPADETGDVALEAEEFKYRKFLTPGEYRWTATRADGSSFTPPITGIVRVRDHTMF